MTDDKNRLTRFVAFHRPDHLQFRMTNLSGAVYTGEDSKTQPTGRMSLLRGSVL